MAHITAVILTHNESAHIVECLASVAFADARLVFDSFSTDDTVDKARSVGARVIQHEFVDYPNQRNAALAAAGVTDWVLFVDADERIPEALALEIRSVADQPGYAAWKIPRHNYIFGRLTRGAGWYPDYQTRLLRVGQTRYDPGRAVHEVIVADGPIGVLSEPLIHYNYRDLAHFLEKQRRYTAYEAQILFQQGIRPKARNYILQPLRHFRWRFFTLRGYIDGWHGLRLSGLMAWYEFRKYWLLRGLWR